MSNTKKVVVNIKIDGEDIWQINAPMKVKDIEGLMQMEGNNESGKQIRKFFKLFNKSI